MSHNNFNNFQYLSVLYGFDNASVLLVSHPLKFECYAVPDTRNIPVRKCMPTSEKFCDLAWNAFGIVWTVGALPPYAEFVVLYTGWTGLPL